MAERLSLFIREKSVSLQITAVHGGFTMEKNKTFTMSETELVNKWLTAFGVGVDKEILEEHVTAYGNHLWHLFTWGEVKCLKE